MVNQKFILNRTFRFYPLFICLIGFLSCSNIEKEASKRIEIAKIVESRSSKDLLNDLYIGSDGDIESLSRMLGVTPSSIDRIRNGITIPTEEFEERIKNVFIYYAQNGQSYSKLRAAIDEEWRWYDSILHWPYHYPWFFWTVNIILILVLAFAAIIAIYPILAEILLFFVVWMCSLIYSLPPIEDKYVDSINPIIEQLR